MSKSIHALGLVLPLLTLLACGGADDTALTTTAPSDNEVTQPKHPSFEPISYAIPNLMGTIFNSSIRVELKYEGTFSDSAKDTLQKYVRLSILQWLAPLRTYMNQGHRITSNVEFVSSGANIVVVAKDTPGRSNYDGWCFIVCSGPVITLYQNDVTNYQVVLHEFGHAFGLGDVYIEGVWSCKEEQYKDSVMCKNSSNYLSADDIRGIRYMYCSVHSGYCNAHDFEDRYGGSGGKAFNFDCSGKRIAYGVNARSGSKLDSVQLLCNLESGADLEDGPVFGGTGGAPGYYSCPGTSYVRGIRIRSGSVVDSIELLCSDGTFSGRIGGGGGTSDVGYVCPSEYPALKGIRGRSDRLIDSLGLTCSNLNGQLYTRWYPDAP
jgi:hypothetical protein